MREAFAMFPDRRKGKNKRDTMVDAALSAFAVFFTQSPSWLAHQKAMEKARGKSNALTLFRVAGIPTENRVRDRLDPLSPRLLDPAFARLFRLLGEAGALAGYTGVGGLRLFALDGTQFHASDSIHCAACTVKKHTDGHVSYRHTAVTPSTGSSLP